MKFSRAFSVALAMGLVAAAAFAASTKLKVRPSAFNPGNAAVSITAQWRPHEGVPGGHPDHGLILAISALVPYPPGASADATVEGVNGMVLNSLGFDHKLGTYCTNGSPRFSVETVGGGNYAFGCAAGTHTPIAGAPGWERITFSNADVQVLSGPPWPGFGTAGAAMSFLQLLMDEAGSTTVDNLQVNGIVVDKPGPAR